MRTAFVSGTFDILHAGHIAFFQSARALAERLVVCLPSDRIVQAVRSRPPAMSVAQKQAICQEIRCVDEICIGDDDPPYLNFASHLRRIKPDCLCATSDDQHVAVKVALCQELGIDYIRMPKEPHWAGCSSTELRQRLGAPTFVPARVDFAGGWLDVPRFAIPGAYIVNCTITPGFTGQTCPYPPGAGVGGSAAMAILRGENAVDSELAMGAGWQDPAVIQETGLCVWRSGTRPYLELKCDPRWLTGLLALRWTGTEHHTAKLVGKSRPYDQIEQASRVAYQAVKNRQLVHLSHAINFTYGSQLEEGMPKLDPRYGELAMAQKYCGAGWGGYALYLFRSAELRGEFLRHIPDTLAVEPYVRW